MLTRSTTVTVAPPRAAAQDTVEKHGQAVPPPKADILALVSAGVGLLSLAPLPPPLRATMLAAFILTGPGLAVVTWMRLQRPAVIAAVPILGLSPTTGSTAVLGWLNMRASLDVWSPIVLLLTFVGGVIFSALLH